MSDVLPYRTMAYNNAWANHRLLTACLGLSQDGFTVKRTGFFPSLRATLNHILIIDHFYVDAMEGGTLGPAAWADQEPCATVAALKEAQAAVDRRLLKIVEALDSAGLQRIVSVHRGTSIQRERMDRLLLHLFQHQVHHRGQAHSMLSATSVSPPARMNRASQASVPPEYTPRTKRCSGPRPRRASLVSRATSSSATVKVTR